jgi:hypothetical protein
VKNKIGPFKVEMVEGEKVDRDSLPPNAVLMQTVEDADRVLMSTVYELSGGTVPPVFEAHAEILFCAVSALTGTLLSAGSKLAHEGQDPVQVAMSSAHSMRLLVSAATKRIVEDAENLVAMKLQASSSSN